MDAEFKQWADFHLVFAVGEVGSPKVGTSTVGVGQPRKAIGVLHAGWEDRLGKCFGQPCPEESDLGYTMSKAKHRTCG